MSTLESAATATPLKCSALRRGHFVLMRDRPCRIIEMNVSKPGKHGHAKIHLVGIDIFTGKKYEDICPSTHNVMVPNVEKHEYDVIDVSDDGYLSLLKSENNKIRDDIHLPDGDMGKEIRDKHNLAEPLRLTIVKCMNQEAVLSYKTDVAIRR